MADVNKLPRYDYYAARNCLHEIASHYPGSPRTVRGKNFLTPEYVATIMVGQAHVELSFGKGMGDYAMYGLTVVDRYGAKQDCLTRALFTLEGIEKFLRLVKQVTEFSD